MEKERPQYIGMKGTPRYEAMIIMLQKKRPPMTRTEALKLLMNEGAKSILKDCTFPEEDDV